MKQNMKTAETRHRRGPYNRTWIIGLLWATLITATLVAVQTNTLEVGRNSNYDDTVKIERDATGKMTFVDTRILLIVPYSSFPNSSFPNSSFDFLLLRSAIIISNAMSGTPKRKKKITRTIRAFCIESTSHAPKPRKTKS